MGSSKTSIKVGKFDPQWDRFQVFFFQRRRKDPALKHKRFVVDEIRSIFKDLLAFIFICEFEEEETIIEIEDFESRR